MFHVKRDFNIEWDFRLTENNHKYLKILIIAIHYFFILSQIKDDVSCETFLSNEQFKKKIKLIIN